MITDDTAEVLNKLLVEKNDLENKIKKLSSSLLESEISDYQKELMSVQLKYMQGYHSTLLHRMEDLSGVGKKRYFK